MNSINIKNKKIELFNNISSKCKIANIKSWYILKKIFSNIYEFKYLKIIKYSKKIQKKLNIRINDFEEASLKYSSIEIEIIPIKSKYFKFVNINNETDKKYYHIYLNNEKKEIKRNFCKEKDNVKKIIIKIDYQVKSFYKLFQNCQCIESINFKQFYRNTISDMSCMFGCCNSLKEINLSKFKTDNVTKMSDMFSWCVSLTKLNLSNFQTNKVTDMAYMFSGCRSLKELDLSNFNTNNIIDLSGMFNECSSLIKLNLSSFNTKNVVDMSYIFSGCSLLKELNLSNFNIENIKNIDYMFYNCSSLKDLNFPNFENLGKKIFFGCSAELKKKYKVQKDDNIDNDHLELSNSYHEIENNDEIPNNENENDDDDDHFNFFNFGYND